MTVNTCRASSSAARRHRRHPRARRWLFCSFPCSSCRCCSGCPCRASGSPGGSTRRRRLAGRSPPPLATTAPAADPRFDPGHGARRAARSLIEVRDLSSSPTAVTRIDRALAEAGVVPVRSGGSRFDYRRRRAVNAVATDDHAATTRSHRCSCRATQWARTCSARPRCRSIARAWRRTWLRSPARSSPSARSEARSTTWSRQRRGRIHRRPGLGVGSLGHGHGGHPDRACSRSRSRDEPWREQAWWNAMLGTPGLLRPAPT